MGNQELRKSKRNYLVFYLRVFNRVTNQILGYAVNLSADGIMILSDSPVPVGERFALKMRLPAELQEKESFSFDAVSRWCKKDENPDFYVSGLELHNINNEALYHIERLIEKFSC